MASSTRHLCRSLQQSSRITRIKRTDLQTTRNCLRLCRPFSSATTRYIDDTAATGRRPAFFAKAQAEKPSQKQEPAQREDVLRESEYLVPENPYTASDLDPHERADYEVLSKEDQVSYLKLQNHFKAVSESDDGKAEMQAIVDKADREIEREGGPEVALDFPSLRASKNEIGFWAIDEEDEFAQMEDGDDDISDDMITSTAESELDLHRDIREYTRIAAWDLPLLQQYAKPFKPPTHASPLRFRYTTYMGESHPAQSKVVVEFSTKDLLSHPTQPLAESQRTKLIKLVGVRYNPITDVVKMSSEKFPNAAQNKRYLAELVGNLIKEAKDTKDTFEDVPFDFRHVKNNNKNKKTLEFPESWKMRKDTVLKIGEVRKERAKLLAEVESEPSKAVVDGEELVKAYVRTGAVKQSRLLKI